MARITPPKEPADLQRHEGILLRSPPTGRIRSWPLRNRSGEQVAVELWPRVILSVTREAGVGRARKGAGAKRQSAG